VADFGAIARRREPDNPVKDGALSEPFLLARARKKRSRKKGHGKALTRVQKLKLAKIANCYAVDEPVERRSARQFASFAGNPDGSAFLFMKKSADRLCPFSLSAAAKAV
jgi:hypothetical protein